MKMFQGVGAFEEESSNWEGSDSSSDVESISWRPDSVNDEVFGLGPRFGSLFVEEAVIPRTSFSAHRRHYISHSANQYMSGSMEYNLGSNEIRLQGLPAALAALGMVLINAGNNARDERMRRVEAEERENETRVRAEREVQEANERTAEAEREKEAAQQKANKEEELRKLGIQPTRQVSAEEILNTRLEVNYHEDHVNIGVVGRQNEGKSTLVNCFRGMRHDSPGSAKIGETECTRTSSVYLDALHPGVAWHDVPGGGTGENTAWGYYYKQKLFAYDKLLLVHSSTLSELDLHILQLCKYLNQECIVARTKADEHIRNCKRRGNHATIEAARNDYVNQVRRDTEENNMKTANAPDLCPNFFDHIISEMGITQAVKRGPPSDEAAEQIIDERKLLESLGL